MFFVKMKTCVKASIVRFNTRFHFRFFAYFFVIKFVVFHTFQSTKNNENLFAYLNDIFDAKKPANAGFNI
jgi:hypothetical protein